MDDANVSSLCRRFGISRRTGYKWIGRYRLGGAAALADRSRRPHASPSRSSEAIERAVMQVRIQHPAWGPRKIRRVLLNDGHDPSAAALPAASTIGQILLRRGLIDPAASSDHRAFVRFEKEQPLKGLRVALLYKTVSRQYLDNSTSEDRRIKPYQVLDLRLRYAIKPVFVKEIEFGVLLNNVLNRKYVANGYTYGYPDANGTQQTFNWYFPQATRHVLASVGVKF